jgi:hypothetical protein
MPIRRRALISSMSSITLACFVPRRLRAQAPPAEAATSAAVAPGVTVRTITKGPKFHWFAYYDKLQFDPRNRFVLSHQASFEGRQPRPNDVIKVGMVDTVDSDRWIELGESRAWNWQQGAMLQWLPGSQSEVIWNDREGGLFVSHILDVKTKRRRTLPHPIYAVSPDGRWAIAPDFRRLNDRRPGYGYEGIPDPHKDVAAPMDAGIWKMDLRTGKQELIFSFADALAVKPAGPWEGAAHWFNHLLWSPDGARFVWLHRWRGLAEGKKWKTRMLTARADGGDAHVVNAGDDQYNVSHFIWRDPRHILAWAHMPKAGEAFYLFRDRSRHYEVVGHGVMTEDGHCTYVPRRNNEWILNDTYAHANPQRLQRPYLYHVPSGKKHALGAFHSPPAYQGAWRVDTHPRASRDGNKITIDSAHDGGRQQHLIDISSIVGRPRMGKRIAI